MGSPSGKLSHGTKSLDDFVKAFAGPPSTGPEVKPYTFDDVVRTINSVQPYDWAGFFRERLQSTAGHTRRSRASKTVAGSWSIPIQPSEIWRDHEAYDRVADLEPLSIGLIWQGGWRELTMSGSMEPRRRPGWRRRRGIIGVNRAEV